jgi:hypothetical protein
MRPRTSPAKTLSSLALPASAASWAACPAAGAAGGGRTYLRCHPFLHCTGAD